MTINNRPIPSIQQVQNERFKQTAVKQGNTSTQNSFNNILQQQLKQKDAVKFSKHANMRLESRGIKLNDEQMMRLENGISKAQQKGIKESLVLMDDVALVVNVENKTVVTALDHSEAREHVFTNIDGAVVI